MENLPTPDFFVHFYNGVRLYHSLSKNLVEFKIPRNLRQDYKLGDKFKDSGENLVFQKSINSINKSEMDLSVRGLYEHAQECFRKCTEFSQQAEKDPKATYPIIIKSQQSPADVSRSNSPTNSMHGSINTFSSTVKDCHSPYAVSSSSTRMKPPLSSRRNADLRETFRDSKASNGNSSTISISHKFTPKYIANVGWCVQTPDRKYCILFGDGVNMIVNPKGLMLEYTTDQTYRYFFLISYKIDKNLPEHVKTRLSQFPKFFKLFKDGNLQ